MAEADERATTERVTTERATTENSGNLTKAALRGSAITVAGQGVSALIRLGSNLIITRLLLPEHFGVMAIVTVFIMGLHLFSDIGVGPNIIQSKRGDDPLFLNTAWTVQVLRGFVIWMVACALAWPTARFYGIAELNVLLPVTGLNAIVIGFESTKLFTLNRSLSFLRITVLEVAGLLCGVTAMIAAAWLLRSVWALVISTTVTYLVRTTLSHLMLPGQSNRFAWDPEARRALFDFGRWILVSTALTFLAAQSDRLLLGKAVSTVELGIYSIGASLAALPVQVIGQVSSKVFFPVVSSAMRQEGHDPGAIRRSRAKLMAVLVPLIALAVAMSPAALEILYDERYHRAGVITAYLSIGAWLATISNSYGVVLLAAARPKALSLGNVAKTATIFLLLWPVTTRFGIEGAALLVALSELAFLVVAQLASRRERVVTWAADIGITAAGAALVGVYFGLHHLLLEATSSRVLALAAVIALALGLCGALFKRVRLLAG